MSWLPVPRRPGHVPRVDHLDLGRREQREADVGPALGQHLARAVLDHHAAAHQPVAVVDAARERPAAGHQIACRTRGAPSRAARTRRRTPTRPRRTPPAPRPRRCRRRPCRWSRRRRCTSPPRRRGAPAPRTVATKVAGSLSAPPSDDGTSIRKNPPATRASTTSRGSLRLRSPSSECAASRGASARAASSCASPIGSGSVADDGSGPPNPRTRDQESDERASEPPVALGRETRGDGGAIALRAAGVGRARRSRTASAWSATSTCRSTRRCARG